MAEEAESAGSASDPLAFTLGSTSQLDPRAAVFLEKQGRLIELQIADLEREDAVRHWSLRVRHISDVLKLMFQFSVAVIGACVVIGLVIMVWMAAHDSSLIIEAFHVPPDLAATGLDGETIAARLQDKLAVMEAETNAGRRGDAYVRPQNNETRVQIPSTGITFADAYRALTSWLGHQTHITGEVWHDGKSVAIAVRAGSGAATTIGGADTAIDPVLQRAAEAIFARTQPYLYGTYVIEGHSLDGHTAHRLVTARAVFQRLAGEGSTARERAWGEAGVAIVALVSADLPDALTHQRRAVALSPDFGMGWDSVKWFEQGFEHEESALRAAHQVARLMSRSGDGELTERARILTMLLDRGDFEAASGDYIPALADYRAAAAMPEWAGEAQGARYNVSITLANLHDVQGAHAAIRQLMPAGLPTEIAPLLIVCDPALGDWAAVMRLRDAAEAALQKDEFRHQGAQLLWPHFALAMAHMGDVAGAQTLIGRTPLDCDLCVRTRGDIAALKHDWAGAARWFAMVAARSPSIPFADMDWGAMLMAKGDADAAITKFKQANAISPHFADPMEMWGEALIAKNRSDLALAKFEEAAKYAPHWGRLHLKWGEALFYGGDKAKAREQFAIASHLDLTPNDRGELARVGAS